MDTTDRVLTRRELMDAINVTSTETIRRKLKDKKLPPPDVKLSQRIVGWRRSTLVAAGINVP
jgi:predicted DNA-binding transcriptional regulator AlpA